MPHSLLKFQIGPVQEFIAQARSTRDLWSGSYLLSWLVAAGIRKLKQEGGNLIFPYDFEKCQPLLELPDSARAADHKGLLTPNLPNIFIAKISTEKPGKLASEVKATIAQEWQNIARAVWNQRQCFGLPDTSHDRFFAQVNRHLAISWQITPLTDDSTATYLHAYQHNGWHLDAVRQTRDFHAWNSAVESENERLMTEKDSLSGKEEALIGGKDFKEARADQGGEYAKLFKHADYLGATALIKRVWHIAYLCAEMDEKPSIKAGHGQNHIRSIPAIAARSTTLDDDEEAQEKTPGDKYIAAIAFDGDKIGQWVNGDFLEDKSKLREHHSDFSRYLSNFALGEVRKIVERHVDGWDKEKKPIKVPLGQLIYAGGDDVVCLVPADAALSVARALRVMFRWRTRRTPSTGKKPDASAGIAIAHIHAPLQDLIREAQKAEKRAKNEGPRPAVSVTTMKRSGEISRWTAQWDKGGLDLYQIIASRMKPGGLSAKFPHRVCQLLSPYLTQNSGMSKQEDAIDAATAKNLIAREFSHAAERQGSKDLAMELSGPLSSYLDNLPAETQALLIAIIDLCTTVAFADRTKPSTAE